jgi:Immunity protein 8
MIRPRLRYLHSPDLEEPTLPSDPKNCMVLVQAIVGPGDDPGEESFDFCVVTPSYLQQHRDPRWGRGLLIVESFDWAVVRRVLEERLSSVTRSTWEQVGLELNKELLWEFDNYRDR